MFKSNEELGPEEIEMFNGDNRAELEARILAMRRYFGGTVIDLFAPKYKRYVDDFKQMSKVDMRKFILESNLGNWTENPVYYKALIDTYGGDND